ncbi:hypothetical protein NEIMUCOT_05720 [Neisseria mucosa ATCC 25996]|uniref:Uncharacterized protein n=1 Tax=Neisseria mucosa (strain ATCC 25996 / DSM 4631 / NCTC 10774 / M26) TaxID=546266 RepID=D2ZYK9_NEIM2|nr:hypothetical protein NEIMUCOT_05720 [Neisseria mucosa ATCC 25996]
MIGYRREVYRILDIKGRLKIFRRPLMYSSSQYFSTGQTGLLASCPYVWM